MVGSANSLSIAEAMHAHKLDLASPAARAKYHNVAKDTLYDYHPNLDEHIVHSQSNLANAEDRLGHKWVIEDEPAYVPPHERAIGTEVDLRTGSDPICSSAGCTQFKHKATPLGYDLDYFVANHGPDPDMVGT
jgi:hypothetical protein